jgi:hypothetical protein
MHPLAGIDYDYLSLIIINIYIIYTSSEGREKIVGQQRFSLKKIPSSSPTVK